MLVLERELTPDCHLIDLIRVLRKLYVPLPYVSISDLCWVEADEDVWPTVLTLQLRHDGNLIPVLVLWRRDTDWESAIESCVGRRTDPDKDRYIYWVQSVSILFWYVAGELHSYIAPDSLQLELWLITKEGVVQVNKIFFAILVLCSEFVFFYK